MKSLHLTVLLSFLLVVGKVKGQAPECIDSSKSFTDNKWQTTGDVEYDDTAEAFVLKSGSLVNPKLYKEGGDFSPEDPKKTTYLYIQYEPTIFGTVGDVQFIVYPNKDWEQEFLDLEATNGASVIKIVEISKDAFGGVDVRIEANNLDSTDKIHVSRIGIWYGEGTPEEIQLALEDACGWTPPITTTGPTTEYEPKALTKVDCIDTLDEYDTNSVWDFEGELASISDSGSITFFPNPPKDGKDVFYMNGNEKRRTFLRPLSRDDFSLSDQDSFFLYIKHYSHIPVLGTEKLTVKPADNPNYFEDLQLASNSQWGDSWVQLTNDLDSFDVSIYVDNYKPTEYFVIDKLAIVYGQVDGRSNEEMIQAIESACLPTATSPTEPASSSSSTDSSSTDGSSKTTDSSPVTDDPTNSTDPSSSSTDSSVSTSKSTTTPTPTELVVEKMSTEADFENHRWTSLPKYKYAASPNSLPKEIQDLDVNLAAIGILYFEGADTRAQFTIQKELTYKDFSQPTSMYISYYTVFQASGEARSIVVSPTEPERLLGNKNGTTWGEELVRLNPTQGQNQLEININGFRKNEYFLLDEIYLVHGKEFDDVDEIKDFVDKYIAEHEDDGGFGTTELVLVTVLPALAVALVCTTLYFYLRRR